MSDPLQDLIDGLGEERVSQLPKAQLDQFVTFRRTLEDGGIPPVFSGDMDHDADHFVSENELPRERVNWPFLKRLIAAHTVEDVFVELDTNGQRALMQSYFKARATGKTRTLTTKNTKEDLVFLDDDWVALWRAMDDSRGVCTWKRLWDPSMMCR